MTFIIFIGLVVVLFIALNAQSRVSRLEQVIKNNLSQGSSVQNSQLVSAATVIATQTQATISTASSAPNAPFVPAAPGALEKFGAWIKEDWLLKLGAFLLLIGFGWLTTYAFLNNWIGPMGRIALGIIAGALILALGWWRINKYIHQGGIFMVLGSTTILLTVFAAREIYNYFTPLTALLVMFLSTAFVAFASVRYNSRSLALSSLILAGIAPLFTNYPTMDYVALFSYLFVVTLGAVWIVVLTGRRELTTAALVLIVLYSLPHLTSYTSADKGILLLFAYAFAALFFLTNTAGLLRLKDKDMIPDLITAAGNGIFLLTWIMMHAQDEWKSLIISAWMVVFAAGAFMIFKITQRREPFYIYAGVGVAMLAAATSAELNGATLTIAYTIEAVAISIVAYLILKNVRTAQLIGILLICPVILSSTNVFSRNWSVGVLHKDFFVLLILGLAFLSLGLFFLRLVRESQDKGPRQFNGLLFVAGSIYIYILLWLSLQAGLQNDNTAIMIALVIYTIVGLISYFYGLKNGERGLQLYGGVMVGFVVGRLLLVDVWRMEMAGRIATFFLIGALLISTAFLGKKRAAVLLVLLLGFAPYSPTVMVPTVNAQNNYGNFGNVTQITSAYRDYKDLDNLSIIVPTVIEIPFNEEYFERPEFAVLNRGTNDFEPYFFKQENKTSEIPVSVNTNPYSYNANFMVDNNPQSYGDFPLPETTLGRVQITLSSSAPITASSIVTLLDNNVALPNSVEILVEENGQNRIVVANKKMDQATVYFPKTTSNKWTVSFNFSQPLRISELRLIQENAVKSNVQFIRFLAQPNNSYRIYSDPDRSSKIFVREAGNLAFANDILKLPATKSLPNLNYLISDVDADGTPDILDNCVTVSNSKQEDVNKNGRGDACDDFDQDGIVNHLDNCQDNPNQNQKDADSDGLGDVCDKEESRVTEKYTWIPWVGIGFAALVLIILLALTARSKSGTPNENAPSI